MKHDPFAREGSTRAFDAARVKRALEGQPLLAGLGPIVSAIQRRGELAQFPAGTTILAQGGLDNDIHFILSGQVLIHVNGRRVAQRGAGTHVGEMALLDPTAKRSATVVAAEPTVALRLSEPHFTRLAQAHPILWRRLATEIASRLRERNRGIAAPHSEPVIFVGSSSEALSVAERLRANLARANVVRLWTDGVFQASRTSIENLVLLAEQTDFAILVLTPDDVTRSRGRQRRAPRDNLIFELGLFIGAIGRERVFVLQPHGTDLKIPTDLFGVTFLEYERRGPKPLQNRLRQALRALRSRIRTLGPT